MLHIKDETSGPAAVFFSSQHTLEREERRFDWDKMSSGKSRLLFCDSEGLWYQEHIDAIREYLNRIEPVLMVGCSRGGYAALLFAHFMKCPSLTFSPQTILQDQRWPEIEKARQISRYPDLSFISGGQHVVYYCNGKSLDVWHAKRLDVTHIEITCDTHAVATVLKQRGQLNKILGDAWLPS